MPTSVSKTRPTTSRSRPAAGSRSRKRATERPRAAVRSDAADASDDTTRGKILATALQVFAERGFDGARTRDIAEQAGANLGLITYYFGNKDGLWREAVASAFAELQRELADTMAALPADDVRGRLEQLTHRFIRFVARKPEFMRLMNDEGKHESARMRWLVDRYVRPMHETLRALIERGQALGLLPPIPPVSLHYIFLGAAGLVFSQAPECRRITGVDPTDEAFATAHADAIIRLFVESAIR
jgi:AcrR family transcriptional regulator